MVGGQNLGLFTARGQKIGSEKTIVWNGLSAVQKTHHLCVCFKRDQIGAVCGPHGPKGQANGVEAKVGRHWSSLHTRPKKVK
jgi:hypothetical protein